MIAAAPGPGIGGRKHAEMRRKLSSVEAELVFWEKASEVRQPFEKHHTQIRRLAAVLRAMRGLIDRRLGDAGESAGGLADEAQAIERLILELHRIWEFYRGKLALRGVEHFAAYLAAADDFAWACYEPPCKRMIEAVPDLEARTAARLRVREPPLTFFNGGASPFTMPRGGAYEAEEVPGEALRTAEFAGVLRALPIPVIGVPWFQLAHLPDALVIGHEVGHDVEGDLGLTEDIETLVKGAVPPERRSAWVAWSGEVFADVFGTLAGGPAFVGALIDFLVIAAADVASERQGAGAWDLYPTTYLRVLLALQALREIDAVLRAEGEAQPPFTAEADRLQAEWLAEFGPAHAMPEYAEDVAPVVRALLATPYPSEPWGPGKRLCDALRFTPDQQRRAGAAAALANENILPQESDVRCLVAAARIAFERVPELAQQAQALILDQIRRVRSPGIRADGIPLRTLTLGEGQAGKEVKEHDVGLGGGVYETLREKLGLADPPA